MSDEIASSDKKYLFIEKDNAYPYMYTTCKDVINVLKFNGFRTYEGEGVDKVFILNAEDTYNDYHLFLGGLDIFPRFKHEVIDTLSVMGVEIVFIVISGKGCDDRAKFKRAVDKHLANI